ncbi:hypothetical protein [Streptococcus ovis]|uniref:hypothetical protein n=1 Tax=Streptococcus ovis TaxID=82806 RepID=UPI000369650A|nr:hypothetical protein [Streptococcus ovis]
MKHSRFELGLAISHSFLAIASFFENNLKSTALWLVLATIYFMIYYLEKRKTKQKSRPLQH